MIDETKTLEQLENDIWIGSDFPTGLVEKCYRYRKIPIKDLTIEQLRLLIGQNFGLPFLIPKAIKYLEKDLFAEGNLYPGDLLNSVLSVKEDFWKTNKEARRILEELLRKGLITIETHEEPKYFRQLKRKMLAFLDY